MTKLRSFYHPHVRVYADEPKVDPLTGEVLPPLPSMTKQSFKEECDINNIIKQYKMTGMVNHISGQAQKGVYTDLPDPMEFQEALHLVEVAEASFATLPSKVRERFQNNPAGFLAFVQDPANKDELVKLGLTKPVAPAGDPAPAPVPPSPPAGAGGTGG